MMANEKPGSHGERSVAIGVLDMAVWDAVSKIEGRSLYKHLADRFCDGKVDDQIFLSLVESKVDFRCSTVKPIYK